MAKPSTYFHDLLMGSAKGSAGLKPEVGKSIDWFRESVATDGNNIRRRLKLKTTLHAPVCLPGHMYFFGYEAKYKDVLPYWDAFPLIFPLSDDEDSFLGMNMHYLQPNLRAKLFDAITVHGHTSSGNEQYTMKMSYKTLKAASKYSLFQPCIKRYLKTHMRTKFIWVPMNEWDDALFLPVADWKNASHSTVWSDTSKYNVTKNKRKRT